MLYFSKNIGIILIHLLVCIAGYNYNYNKLPNFNPTHLDKSNLERLEKMFYLKNSRYNPMRNRIYVKYLNNETNINETNEEEIEKNITKVLENINNEFMKSYEEQVEKISFSFS